MDKKELEKRKTLRRAGNPVWGVFWKLLVCCLVIDALILGYFNLIKGVTLAEGIRQLQHSVAGNKRPPKRQVVVQQKPEEPRRQVVIRQEPIEYTPPVQIQPKSATQATSEDVEKTEQPQEQTKKYVLYSWQDETGYRQYSNTGFPTDRPYKDPQVKYY